MEGNERVHTQGQESEQGNIRPPAAGLSIGQVFSSLPATVVQVLTRPVEFYRDMPRTGGFLAPLIFMVAMGLVCGLIGALSSLVGFGVAGALASGMMAIIVVPIMVGIFGFVGAAIFFVIWKMMGSNESYETAFRCLAYASAIAPVTALLGLVPYVGGVAGLAWYTYLLVTASVEVHGLKARTAWIGFGVICALFALTSLSAEFASRKMAGSMASWQQEMNAEKFEEMSPEEAGKALGDFMKGLQKAAEGK